MNSLYIDCQNGISGDMLLSAFLDLGLPNNLLKDELKKLGLNEFLSFNSFEDRSYGIRGIKVNVKRLKNNPYGSKWKEIKVFIEKLSIKDSIKVNILKVYQELAQAESIVHGCEIDEVKFHELASLETFVNILGVCFAFDHFNYKRIFTSNPPAGAGHIKTEHGDLPVPVPTVLEISRRNKVSLTGGNQLLNGELTTPSGIALISCFTDLFEQPFVFDICNIGIGLGTRDNGKANFLRLVELNNFPLDEKNEPVPNISWQNLISQEAWIDDASSEDLAELTHQLRSSGALEVVSYPVQMKKGRQGVSIKALVLPELAAKLRSVWFLKGTTIGLRENSLGRWILPRRLGNCNTPYGNLRVKQIKRIDGLITTKIEHDEIVRLSKQEGKSLDEIRNLLLNYLNDFTPEKDWSF